MLWSLWRNGLRTSSLLGFVAFVFRFKKNIMHVKIVLYVASRFGTIASCEQRKVQFVMRN